MKARPFFLLAFIAMTLLSARRHSTVYDLKYVEQGMKYIPSKSFVTGAADQDSPNAQKAKTVSVDSFFLFQFETSNGFYGYYLGQLKSNGKNEEYLKALPDTLVWRKPFAYNEPYVDYYFRHPAYRDYPVVGVTYDQAIQFCSWLTTTYNAWPERKYKKAVFDLPSKNQWMSAAYGTDSYQLFPWKGTDMMNEKTGWNANFRKVRQANVYRDTCSGKEIYIAWPGGDDMGIPGRLNDYADITYPVKSFAPSEFGIYNMGGNVEEMMKEKGITKGGSWRDTGYYLVNAVEEHYTDSTPTSSERGFRIVMKVAQK